MDSFWFYIENCIIAHGSIVAMRFFLDFYLDDFENSYYILELYTLVFTGHISSIEFIYFKLFTKIYMTSILHIYWIYHLYFYILPGYYLYMDDIFT